MKIEDLGWKVRSDPHSRTDCVAENKMLVKKGSQKKLKKSKLFIILINESQGILEHQIKLFYCSLVSKIR